MSADERGSAIAFQSCRHLSDHPRHDVPALNAALLPFVERRMQSRHDAEDIVQESLLRSIVAPQSESIGNLRAYLYRIAGNLSIDTLRHRNVRERISGASLDSPEARAVASAEPSPDQVMIERERRAAFDAALMQLPVRQRQALMLNRIDGWPYPRIAEHLGCSPNTVYNDVKAAMKHIIAQTADLDL
jgi:RNA polymerase sigma-70 factor (ECF subfamily)